VVVHRCAIARVGDVSRHGRQMTRVASASDSISYVAPTV
jgi:hypothetical protein